MSDHKTQADMFANSDAYNELLEALNKFAKDSPVSVYSMAILPQITDKTKHRLTDTLIVAVLKTLKLPIREVPVEILKELRYEVIPRTFALVDSIARMEMTCEISTELAQKAVDIAGNDKEIPREVLLK